MSARLLTLEAINFQNPQKWHWRLSDASGVFLADHEVNLDTAAWQYQALLDPYGYLRLNVPADRRADEGARRLSQLSVWIGQTVLGTIAEKIVEGGTPVTVRVVIPPQPELADGLYFLPLELAQAKGRPLALQDVSLVFQGAPLAAPPVGSAPVGNALRMLAVFSLPLGTNTLNLRQERHQLKHFMRALAAQRGLALDLRVLQYGVTRKALEKLFGEDEGWDVLHFSGHGLAAHLLLEKEDGSRDDVTADDLIRLLRPARGRLKWVTLSACQSAAATVRETLRWMGIETPERDLKTSLEAATATPAKPLPALARALMDELDCAVLAMRYPVEDQFAIELGQSVYQKVFEQGQPLTRALQMALPQNAGPSLSLAVATPALFGRRAAELRLTPPINPNPFAPTPRGLAYFPDEKERLVGRVEALAKSSGALAPDSSQSGVLFHGMAGAGKTSCALELAYQHEDARRFQGFVWYQAPAEDQDIGSALVAFAKAWETQLSDANFNAVFPMVQIVEAEQSLFDAYWPRLRLFLERNSLLIVLDNVESLLRSDGVWRDPRWATLIATLLGHNGLSRTVLTSRRLPALPPTIDARLLKLPIHALTRDETALLARQLPNLGALLRGEKAHDDASRAQHRLLVARTLHVVQGHPKLLELAEGQAGDAALLQMHIERATTAWAAGEGPLNAFFEQGASQLSDRDFLKALDGWTRSVAYTLPPASRTLFRFLCSLEEGDRQSWVISAVWPRLWQRLSLPGTAPDIAATIEPLIAAGLVDVKATPVEDDEGNVREVRSYAIHPGVSEAERHIATETDAAFQPAVDEELGAFWLSVYQHGRETETSGGGHLVVRGGRHAVPYLMRRQRWEEAYMLLERVIGRDTSPATIADVLPLLRRIVEATQGTSKNLEAAGILANVLRYAGRLTEAETMMRDILRQAEEEGKFRVASAIAGALINLLRVIGRAASAVVVAEQMKEYTRRAGLGPWTQLGDEAIRLQLLNELGHYEEVLAEVEKLRPQMQMLPEIGPVEEAVEPWNVRETTLDNGRRAALRLKHWDKALELNAEIAAITIARQAPPLEVARTRFNNYSSLLRLGRYEEARSLLWECRAVFETAESTEAMGKVFSALADLEDVVGHHTQAIAFEQAALRYGYAATAPDDCTIGHFNLAGYLMRGGELPEVALAHRLAAVVLVFQSHSGKLAPYLQALSQQLATFPTGAAPLPTDFAALCQIVEQVEGVRFAALFETLPKERAASGDEALAQVLAMAQGIEDEAPEIGLDEVVIELKQAAADGEDIEAILQGLRAQIVQDNPEDEEAADALIAQLRALMAEQE